MTLEDRLKRIKLVLMDVDGVLTDGTIWFLPSSGGAMDETKGFHSQDGIAMQWLHMQGIWTGMISGRKSSATEMRAKTGHCKYVYLGDHEKIAAMEEIVKDSGLAREEIAFLGDDLTDVVCFRRAGISIAVANAMAEVKATADYVTKTPGGQGALREFTEMLLKAQGKWDAILKKYEIT